MDKTAKLIRWQRITIVMLLLGLVAISVYASREVRLLRLQLTQEKMLLEEPYRGYEVTHCSIALGTGGLLNDPISPISPSAKP
jgi:hypothetical protein